MIPIGNGHPANRPDRLSNKRLGMSHTTDHVRWNYRFVVVSASVTIAPPADNAKNALPTNPCRRPDHSNRRPRRVVPIGRRWMFPATVSSVAKKLPTAGLFCSDLDNPSLRSRQSEKKRCGVGLFGHANHLYFMTGKSPLISGDMDATKSIVFKFESRGAFAADVDATFGSRLP